MLGTSPNAAAVRHRAEPEGPVVTPRGGAARLLAVYVAVATASWSVPQASFYAHRHANDRPGHAHAGHVDHGRHPGRAQSHVHPHEGHHDHAHAHGGDRHEHAHANAPVAHRRTAGADTTPAAGPSFGATRDAAFHWHFDAPLHASAVLRIAVFARSETVRSAGVTLAASPEAAPRVSRRSRGPPPVRTRS